MKTTMIAAPFLRLGFWALLMLAAGVPALSAAEDDSFARITAVRIEGTNVVVDVEASADFTKLTLESSTRVGRRAWLPRAVKLIDNTSSAANVTFTVPVSPAIEILRVRGDRIVESLPAEFYTGTNKFTVSGVGTGGFRGGAGGPAAGPTEDGNADGAGGGGARTVVESDIWKVDGDTLFFFNQYRGLQVVDLSDPDSPAITGTYDLPGAGEQMYVLNGTNVVLLARDNCGWYGTDSLSRVVLLEVRNGEPHLVKELSVPGQIAESRLVGTALYVVANSYQRRVTGGSSGGVVSETWEWGSEVLSFDVSDFSAAAQKSRDWISGYGNVIMATDQYLFVAQQDYTGQPPYTSTIHSYDISSPTGEFTKLASFDAGGRVNDKFKMNVDDDTFTVVVQVENWQVNQRSTHVRTFSFADPTDPEFVADLKIIENEQLFATRFDGDRLYAVTFRVIDPLWIIDLSDPAAPRKVGELEIPGWSTFLQPMGDRLLAIGIDQSEGRWRTAVQLFDVADPADPSLLSKVLIGDQWSGSEANWDEKAFGVLPNENLVLVPFYSSGSEGYLQGVQLIDLEENTLVKRGIVEHDMGARRATVHRERLVSLSSRELLTVDISDRDEPAVVNSVELSWAADRVHLVGDFLIEIDASNNGGPAVRVVDADDPSAVRSTLVLTNLPYLGSVEVNDRLYVLQGRGTEYIYPTEYDPTTYFPIATNPAVFVLTELDLAGLPEIEIASRVVKEGSSDYYWGQYNALRVSDDLLVWANKSYGYNWWWRGGPIDIAVPELGGGPGAGSSRDDFTAPGMIAPWWGGSSGHFLAVDLSGEEPIFASEVALSGTNGWWNFGDSFTTDGLVFTSHQASEFDPTIDPPPYVYMTWDGKEYVTATNDPPPGAWVQRYYLDVIDFADSAEPLVRQPVNIPGNLLGIHLGGELLYTRGYDGSPFIYTGEEQISALSYDGLSAHLITAFKLENAWPRPAISDSGMVYLGSPATGTNSNSTLQVWTLGESGEFQQVDSVALSSPAQELEKIGNLFVAQAGAIELYDATNPADLVPLNSEPFSMCYGALLDGADGEVSRGLWLPIGWYGVIHIPAAGGTE